MWQKLFSGHPSLQIFFTCVSVFLNKSKQFFKHIQHSHTTLAYMSRRFHHMDWFMFG